MAYYNPNHALMGGDYYNPSHALMAGDPGFGHFLRKRLRVPRGLRKLTLRRAIGGIAPFVPGPFGNILSFAGAAGDPGFLDFLKPVGRALFGGAKAQLEEKAAAFLRNPAAAAAAAGAAGVAAGAAGSAIARHFGGHGGHKRRTMRVTNVHALKRSLRRLEGFEKLARQVVHFTHPHRGGTSVARFKRKRRGR